MRTSSAARSNAAPALTVRRATDLGAAGWSRAAVAAHVDAGRWQRVGRAVVRHNGTLTADERLAVAIAGRRPCSAGTACHQRRAVAVHPLHRRLGRRSAARADRGGATRRSPARCRRNLPCPGGLRLAGRCGAATHRAGQDLVNALCNRRRIRHHAALLAAAHDVAQGAEALSEIDFARLCRRAGLPEPVRQRPRVEADGRRRYVDAEWPLPDGRRLVVEVDGALHLVAARWWDDQLRQNAIVLAGDVVLRFPSAVVRGEPALVIEQLRHALCR